MALVSMRQLLDHAAENGYGVPAFNVNNIEQVQAIMTAAAEVGAPVIMQASAGARKYAGEAFLRHIIEAAVESWPDVPVCMHQDHGQSPAVCQIAMRMGFTSVMMDGSLMSDGKTVSSYEYNVDVTRRVVENAHCIGVSVEGELGCLGSLETMKGDKEDGHGTDATMSREQLLTDPDQAADFVKATPEDTLVLTLACGKFRFNDLDIGDIGGIPRLLDMGQCNDAYSAIKVASALAEVFQCSVNDLPLSLILSWYEQKAVAILLTLLYLGIKDIRIGPSLPAFVSPAVLNVLVEKFGVKPITTPEEDLKAILG